MHNIPTCRYVVNFVLFPFEIHLSDSLCRYSTTTTTTTTNSDSSRTDSYWMLCLQFHQLWSIARMEKETDGCSSVLCLWNGALINYDQTSSSICLSLSIILAQWFYKCVDWAKHMGDGVIKYVISLCKSKKVNYL